MPDDNRAWPQKKAANRKSIAERLDDSVRWTGIGPLAAGTQRRRPMRAVPAIALLLAAAGIVLALASASPWQSLLAVLAGFAISAWLPFLGPVKRTGTAERIDEREREESRHAFLIAFAMIAAMGFFAALIVPPLRIALSRDVAWVETVLRTLGFAMIVVFNAVPTLVASLRGKPLQDDD